MYEYRQVINRLRSDQSVRSIDRDTGFGRNKIRQLKELAQTHGWLTCKELPDESALVAVLGNYRPEGGSQSLALPYKDLIIQWSESGVSATVIHKHLTDTHGFRGGYNSIQRFIQQYNKAHNKKLTVPLDFAPGEAAQVDFGKGPNLFDEREGREVSTWFFVMTLCWSRHQYAELIVHQDCETWLLCHQHAFEWFGGVVHKVIIDNPKCAITKACYHDMEVQRSYEAFALEYGFLISACPPRDPQKKGRVEAGVKYIKRNFLPLKQFRSLQDANQQLKAWVLGTAGNRLHGSVFEQPLTRFEEIERTQLLPLPTSRPELAIWQQVRLYKDCHIRYLKCRYSAPHTLYDKPLWIKVSSTLVSIYHEHQEVAIHARVFKPGDTQTKREHLPPNAQTYFTQDTEWCLTRSQSIGEHCAHVIDTLLTDPVRELLRQVQKILQLEQRFGAKRLELACQRAIAFQAINYSTIQSILKEGLDYEPLEPTQAATQLTQVYTGRATFQRELTATPH